MKKCKTCSKVLGQSAQRAKTGPNSRITYCRVCSYNSPGTVEQRTKFLQKGRGWNKDKKGLQIAWNKGKKTGIVTAGIFPKGQVPWNKGLVGVQPPPWNKGMGDSGKRQLEMQYSKYINWRTKVFERDDFTCVSCSLRGGKIEADHIKMWRSHPRLRYSIKNGQTLCKPCHTKKTAVDLKIYWSNQYATWEAAVGVHSTARAVAGK